MARQGLRKSAVSGKIISPENDLSPTSVGCAARRFRGGFRISGFWFWFDPRSENAISLRQDRALCNADRIAAEGRYPGLGQFLPAGSVGAHPRATAWRQDDGLTGIGPAGPGPET